MYTLADVGRVYDSVDFLCMICGMTEEFQQTSQQHLNSVLSAILFEQNLAREKSYELLPAHTTLGPRAEDALLTFLQWLYEHNVHPLSP